MTFRTTGIIIGKKDFREYDRLFTIYTLERGKIQAMAQGSRKLASKLAGNLELLNYATFTIAQGKSIDRIATVDVKESFTTLKQSLEKLVVALHCFEVFDQCVKWDECDEVLFETLKDFLETVRDVPETSRVRTAKLFLLKLCLIMGYQPPMLKGVEKISDNPLSTLLEVRMVPEIDKAIASFYEEHLERPLRSKEYFDFLAGA